VVGVAKYGEKLYNIVLKEAVPRCQPVMFSLCLFQYYYVLYFSLCFCKVYIYICLQLLEGKASAETHFSVFWRPQNALFAPICICFEFVKHCLLSHLGARPKFGAIFPTPNVESCLMYYDVMYVLCRGGTQLTLKATNIASGTTPVLIVRTVTSFIHNSSIVTTNDQQVRNLNHYYTLVRPVKTHQFQLKIV